jgi:predicted XRE-type DNA-binding protein
MARSSPVKNAGRGQAATRGSANIFADLGFGDAVERQVKLRLAYGLNHVLTARKLSQADAAKALGMTEPRISALRHYKLAAFSVERLMNTRDRRLGCRCLNRGEWAACVEASIVAAVWR